MDERTLTALKGSIAKWEGIVAGTVENEGPTNCPLCQLFHYFYGGRDSDEECEWCPVRDATGCGGCEGSPYSDYERACGEEDNDEQIASLAQAELDFLRSLLPDESHEAIADDTSRPSPRGTE